MTLMRRWIVDGLEWACRQTDALERLPGWGRVYHCHLARVSRWLDDRWQTGRWPEHGDFDDWSEWFENLQGEDFESGHWHAM